MEGETGIIVLGEDIPAKHYADWTRLPPVRPLALARPRTVAQVSAILRACHETRTPVVPQGGLTGLVGGAHPVPGCVALSLDRMVGVDDVDPVAGTMTVLAGTPLEQVQAAAEEAGWSFPLDLGARGSCTIGGNLATNAGGNRVIRYGTARDHVLGLEVVLPDGTVVSALNRLVKNNTGYDLKQLFIGSEGTLGVITRAVLKLQPRPRGTIVALCAAPGYDNLLMLLGALRSQLGPALTAFEAMWPDFWDFMTTKLGLRPPFAAMHGAYALIEISSMDPERCSERLEACLAGLMDEAAIADALVAQTAREAADFWRIREGVGELRNLLGPITSFDIGLAAQDADAFIRTAVADIRANWPDAVHMAFGHLGDNNVHLVVHIPSAGASQPKAEIEAEVYGALAAFGGSVSAEHGIGLTKKPYLSLSRSEAEIAAMRRIKHAFDPLGIMNPGKLLDST
ncbi:FAD-binding oxidoreductase [Rhodoligotrophos defluvii]|uniref:FAD-binding oxidoreductase n=1 Tax=Rhodoligotrophos defluvii TaxID=2561934 RepID=UPI001EEFD71F|nr:FAD-binding oxidoreductase [Rhodoligotrophos defluvii]